jgi:hypothetical protein
MESSGFRLTHKSLTFQILGASMQTDIEILESRETPGVIWIGR